MLKEKNYDKKDVLDESLIIANVREMSRKELENKKYPKKDNYGRN